MKKSKVLVVGRAQKEPLNLYGLPKEELEIIKKFADLDYVGKEKCEDNKIVFLRGENILINEEGMWHADEQKVTLRIAENQFKWLSCGSLYKISFLLL